MKPTTLTALVLTLFMFLLVLLAAFFFVFQGQITLRDNLASTESEIESLQQEQAQLQLEHSSLQATSTKVDSAQATSAAESLSLTTQLAETDLTVTAQAARSLELSNEIDVVAATRQFYEETGPLVTIIDPQTSMPVNVGDEITFLIVASDPVGVRSINITINNLFEDVPMSPGQNVIARYPWTPEAPGPAIITVTAVNDNGITSQPAAITIQVQSLSATSTPTSTPTPEPTPEPTAENR